MGQNIPLAEAFGPAIATWSVVPQLQEPNRPALTKCYAIPLDLLVPGNNLVEIDDSDKATESCRFVGLELGLFCRDSCGSLP
ncbi:MAG: hypothetical protein RBS80_28290 [Thermoguttaceae bacterium]|nr:hypothetical protein [Thermoguttaceae bacterium]